MNCWWWMQILHELGHVLAALFFRATINAVILPPLAFSRTDVGPSEQADLILWAGPVLGSLIPLWLATLAIRFRWNFWAELRFFAGFALIANGAYLTAGGWLNMGDGGSLRGLGGSPLAMSLWGIIGVAVDLALWHRLGPFFGFGREATIVSPRRIWWYTLGTGATLFVQAANASLTLLNHAP